ncbi:MAG: UDP-4-amino-4,6-dideoxy-N-acetyl-beta-L-altrosamine transaminase [Dehalococcoidia bacterium]
MSADKDSTSIGMKEKLAIEGGDPVRSDFLPYGRQWVDADDIDAVVKVLETDWITTGPKVGEFEERVAQYCGARYAVAVSSGTAALHAACLVAGISRGDEAITTPITFAATANAVVYCGGKPVLADIRDDTLNIDPEEIKKRLSPKTKAILPVDFGGHPADLDEIRAIAAERGLIVIEDAAHALGAEYKGHKIGSLSDMTVFSFHPVKHVTTGEGGMILTNSKEFYEKLRILRHHGMVRDNGESSQDKDPWYYEIDSLGYNYRLTDFQCALGLSQMKKLDRFVQRRREIADKYGQAFAEIEELVTPTENEGVKNAYHIFVIQVKTELLNANRGEILKALRAENIGASVHYVPVHLHPYYRRELGHRAGDYPRAERYYERAITLPIFPRMTDRDVEDVITAVNKVMQYYRR